MNRANDYLAVMSAQDSQHGAVKTRSGARLAGFLESAVVLTVVCAICAACYHQILRGYFLSDDFAHVAFVWAVFHGHPEFLWQNFTSAFMQMDVTKFYRPLIAVSYVADYLLWGINAAGCHLSNLVFHTLDAFGIFLTCRRLLTGNESASQATPGCPPPQANCPPTAQSRSGINGATLTAGLAAALFAAYPLNTEVACFIAGRGDSICLMFILLTLWLYLGAQQAERSLSRRLNLAASALAYVLAALSKEVAVALPPLLVIGNLIFAGPAQAVQTPWRGLLVRFRSALAKTWMFWAITFVYLVARSAALHTPIGGYTGSLGAVLSTSIASRWLGGPSLLRLLFPLNAAVFADGDSLHFLLAGVYAALVAVSVMRSRLVTVGGGEQLAWRQALAFAASWLGVAMLLIFQVFNLPPTLQGARYCYIASAPLCIIFACLLLPPQHWERSLAGVRGKLNLASLVLAALLIGCWIKGANGNAAVWAEAGQRIRQAQSSVVDELAKLPGGTNMVLLNLPKQYKGAYVLLNEQHFGVLLQPPLSTKNLKPRVETFEAMRYSSMELINCSRLRRMLSDPHHKYAFYRWDERLASVVPLPWAQGAAQPVKVHFDYQGNPELPLSITMPEPLPPPSVDFVDVYVKQNMLLKDSEPAMELAMWWSSSDRPSMDLQHRLALPLRNTTDLQRVRFCVSQLKSWIVCDGIKSLQIDGMATPKASIRRVELITGEHAIPVLSPDAQAKNAEGGTMVEDESGTCNPGQVVGCFSYDASAIPGAKQVVYELSQPNWWFEDSTHQMINSSLPQPVLERSVLPALKGKAVEIAPKALHADSPVYLELIVAALDDKGNLLGYCSDPLNIRIARKDQPLRW